MSKNINYQLGDIFKIPVAERFYGIGRILIIKSPALLVGFYKKVIRDDI